MNLRVLFAKCITLLYRETQMGADTDGSEAMVLSVISKIELPPNPTGLQNNELNTLSSLKEYVLELSRRPQGSDIEPDSMLQRLKIIVGEDEKFYEAMAQGIEKEYTDSGLKRLVTNLRQSLITHYREEQVKEIVEKASYAFKFKRDSIKDIGTYVTDLLTSLEPYQQDSKHNDPAILADVSLNSPEQVSSIFKNVVKLGNDEGIMQTGWQDLNEMLQGGFRRGQEVVIGALPHNFKTGVTLSLFKHIAMFNKPHMIDVTKKPLLLRISFEDELDENFKFLTDSLMDEDVRWAGIKHPEMSSEEMSAYITEALQVNGYYVRMLRVDPTLWDYRKLINFLIRLEAEGYEVHLLMLDYLAQMPTTGCLQTGPTGSDIRDLYRRLRNYCSPKKIALITPHQLSPSAKQLMRDGRDDFVKLLPGKGYYDRCSTVDNEVDLELFIHIEKRNRKSYLTIQRGKHRNTKAIDEDLMYMALEFPRGKAIPDDINLPEQPNFRKLPDKNAYVGTSKYDF